MHWTKKSNASEIKKRISESLKIAYANGSKKLSPNCFKKGNKINLGKHHSKEAREKMSKSKSKLYIEGKIKIWNKGKTLPEELKQRISKTVKNNLKCKQTQFKKGDKHRGWLGGKSFEPYGLEFNRDLKYQIRLRDNFTCQECHYTEEQLGYKLSTHHIDYDKTNNDPENLISLCKACHGQTNFGREDWTNYFNNTLGVNLGGKKV